MADIGAIGSSTITTANQVIYNASWFSVILIGVLAIVGLIVFLLYKKTFNVDVIIVRTANGVDFTTGHKGKFFIKGRSNEYRFKIWAAKKNKLLYNEEGISPKFVNGVEDATTKKNRKMIFLSPNSDGFLIPLSVKPETYIEAYEVLLADGVTKQPRKKETHVLKSEYGAVDVSWLESEATKLLNLFDTRSFIDKWGTIIILIGMILVAGALVFTAYKFMAASDNMTEVLRSQSQLIETIARAQNATNNVNIGQPINTIIAG